MEVWIILMSCIAFIQMGYDKMQAKRGKWRVSEKSLWLMAILGGAIGSFSAMFVFRHKIRKMGFMIGFTVLAIVYLFVLVELPRFFPQISLR